MFDTLFGARARARARDRAQARAVVESLYGEVVRRARQPALYLTWGVPDTLDGRYDMLVLHAYVLFRRLGALRREEAARTGRDEAETEAGGLSQAVFDHMLRDLDTNLREAGVSDMRIGSRMKKLTKGFYGRVGGYDTALAAGDEAALRDALDRNVFQKSTAPPEGLAALADYVHALVAASETWTWDDLSHGVIRFPELPAAAAPSAPAARNAGTAETPA
ncbi:ubiquinol-cytochrome C chaperone family protein [Roseospira goensis]|uniref:Cytochrome b pre-mRNA-processing protein 3 n=1 Tax=Roseospira goensis TaxID=391922 RepID=A0A7W6WKY5_9PROT|nr:ubiquinol-cytochrome C chaperone family protein [Roseospira goensis]MBB4286846.1 cytochrome b pre-mRNA-processing protein 3 [Roseospira goensis]